MEDFAPPIPSSPTGQFQFRSVIKQVTYLLGVEGSVGALDEDSAADLVAGEAWVGGGEAYVQRELLKRQVEYLTSALDSIKKRIEELEAHPQDK